MFLHLGGDVLTDLKSIIVIINTENALEINSNQEFLKTAAEEGFIHKIDPENCKSVIVTDKKVYLSPISSQTLKKRASFVNELNELV